jgi:hypothetical protein
MTPASAVTANEVAIFGRLLGKQQGLAPDAARSLLRIGFLPADRVRMRVLAAKARDGTLTPAEQAEVEGYERVGHLLSLLKSKARQSLHQARRSPSRHAPLP